MEFLKTPTPRDLGAQSAVCFGSPESWFDFIRLHRGHARMDDTAHARGEGEDAVEAVQVRVKWQKQKFDVSVRLHAPVEDFRSQVPPQLQNAKPKQSHLSSDMRARARAEPPRSAVAAADSNENLPAFRAHRGLSGASEDYGGSQADHERNGPDLAQAEGKAGARVCLVAAPCLNFL